MIDQEKINPSQLSNQQIFDQTFNFGRYKNESIGKISKHNPAYAFELIKENREGDLADTLFLKLLEYTFYKVDQRCPFGQYSGKSLRKLQQKVPSYLKWLREQLKESEDAQKGWLYSKLRYLNGEFDVSIQDSDRIDPDEIDDNSEDEFE